MGGMDSRAPFACIGGRIPEAFSLLPTPCYVIDEEALAANGRVMGTLAKKTGAKFLLAQKAFSNFNLYPHLAPYLAGTEASGLFEARLGAEEMPGKEVHVFSSAYREDEFGALLSYADHMVFNSPSQVARYGKRAKEADVSVGLRVNPECSTQEGHAIYDPCAPGSRLGTTRMQWEKACMRDASLEGLIDGLHFHTLCEQDADALALTLGAVEEKFGSLLGSVKWLNMGGGHHITRPGYDLALLEEVISHTHEKWGVEVYLEPGEAWALNAGFLLSRVLDVVENGGVSIAILDASAACHMPDVIEMPYKPPLFGSDMEGMEQIFRLAGPTCLAGDVIGDYTFKAPLKAGDLLVFGDMAIYTTCKNNTFNGMPLPAIYAREKGGMIRPLCRFGYEDFKGRLGTS